jgi:biopolymer transport protein ExbB
MRRFLRTSLPVLALMVVAVAATAAAEGGGEAKAKQALSLFDLYLHSMPVGGLLTILSFICFSLALTWTFTLRMEDMVPPGITDEIHNCFAEGITDEAVEQAKGVVAGSQSMLGTVIAAVLEKKDLGYKAMVEVAEEVGVAEHNKIMSKVAWLSLFSSSATLLGLLGTVTGIIGAFLKMASSPGAADPNLLAASIGEALVCTAMGLFIAILGLYFFFFLRNRVNQAALDTSVYAKEVCDLFRPEGN